MHPVYVTYWLYCVSLSFSNKHYFFLVSPLSTRWRCVVVVGLFSTRTDVDAPIYHKVCSFEITFGIGVNQQICRQFYSRYQLIPFDPFDPGGCYRVGNYYVIINTNFRDSKFMIYVLWSRLLVEFSDTPSFGGSFEYFTGIYLPILPDSFGNQFMNSFCLTITFVVVM